MVAPLVAGALLGAGAGYLQGQQKREAEARQRALAAQIALYSPWTHMTPQLPGDTSVTDSMLQGAMGGASFGLANSDKLGAMMGPESVSGTAGETTSIPAAAPAAPVASAANPKYVAGQGMGMYAEPAPLVPVSGNSWDWAGPQQQEQPVPPGVYQPGQGMGMYAKTQEPKPAFWDLQFQEDLKRKRNSGPQYAAR